MRENNILVIDYLVLAWFSLIFFHVLVWVIEGFGLGLFI